MGSFHERDLGICHGFDTGAVSVVGWPLVIAFVVRVVLLAGATHRAWPDVPIAHVVAASVEAARCETNEIRAELLLAIAHHESDLEPHAVSWIENGHRVDRISGSIPDRRLVCGYLQAMASRSDCLAMLADDGGMSAGVLELREWLDTCHGDLTCALRGHAGGTRCALENSCSATSRAFARIFLNHAHALGMQ